MKIKEKEMNNVNSTTFNIIAGSVTVLICVSVICFTFFMGYIAEKELMSKNIESAIAKGIDPIAVRCSYAEPTDNVCLAYSITHRTVDAPSAPPISRK